MLYYLHTHLDSGPLHHRLLGWILAAAGESMQTKLIRILHQSGFSTLPPVRTLKQLSDRYSTSECSVGSGWLLSAEIAGWAQTGYPKVLAALPFACLPGHIYGRGQYAALQRRLPGSLIVGIDYDASIRDGTVQTRIQMLLDEPV
jgi:predicted nucleotide-binding protein (sugar kinase/HSP70/actin superfamily)